MKLFLAMMPGMTTRVWEEMPPPARELVRTGELSWRVLVSFAIFRKEDYWMEQVNCVPGANFEVFADSGAFSAWAQKFELSVDDYIRWLWDHKQHFTAYANLDVRGDLPKTRSNMQALEDAGLNPIPVFHAGEPFSELERLVERYPYIALGGVAGLKQITFKPMVRWLIECFRRAQGKSVFHGFGITGWRALKAFPWHSCDSTSWSQGMRYGSFGWFDSNLGRWLPMQIRGNTSLIGKELREFGFDPARIGRRDKHGWATVGAVGCFSFMRAERWLEQRWGPQPIPVR